MSLIDYESSNSLSCFKFYITVFYINFYKLHKKFYITVFYINFYKLHKKIYITPFIWNNNEKDIKRILEILLLKSS